MSNFIRVLRNKALYRTYELAKTNLEAQLAKLQDGEICIASYGASMSEAKTILGIARYDGSAHSYTIFDNQANSNEIAAEIAKLDAQPEGTSADGKVKVKVVETDGKLTSVAVTTADIASAALLGKETDAAGTDTAFARIAKEAADRATAITNAINGLNGSVAATNDGLHVLTGVTQANGVLSDKTEIQLANVAISGSASDVATTAIAGDTTHVAVAGTNVSAQITSIAETLKTITNNDLKYITVKLSNTEASALGANVKEAYQVVAYTGDWAEGKGTVVGDTIKIYKDATIHEIYLGNSDDTIDASKGTITKGTIDETKLSLNYAYIKADGTYAIAHIPVNSFLREAEFKNGLLVAKNGEVSVKVDTTSEGAENFLSVGQNGVKISGVQTAIGTAINALNVTKSGTDGKVTVQVDQKQGFISGVTVSTTGLALDSEVVKNVTVNDVNATVQNNKATVTIKGGNIAVADTYTATDYPAQFEAKVGADNHIKAADKIDAALKKTENTISVLATEVISNEKVTTAAVSKLAESAGTIDKGGVIEYTPKTDANYIREATSVHDATIKLDAAIQTVKDGALTAVEGGNAITVSDKTKNSQTVSLKLGTGETGDNALVINADGLYLSNVWDCGEY